MKLFPFKFRLDNSDIGSKLKKITPRNFLIIIFGISIVFRIILNIHGFIDTEKFLTPDSYGYLLLAKALLNADFPSVFRTPAYPIFIALTTFGSPENNYIFTIFVQIILDSITALLMIGICQKIFQSPKIAYIAGLMYAIGPVSAVISSQLMSESLYIFLTVSAIFTLVSLRSFKASFAETLFWGTAALTRPSGLFFPLIGFFFTKVKRVETTWRKQVLTIFLYTVIVLLWCGFNYYRTERFFFVTVPDVAIYKYELPAVQMLENYSLAGYIKLWVTDPRKGEPIRWEYESNFLSEVYGRKVGDKESWDVSEDAQAAKMLQIEARKRLQGKYFKILIVHAVGMIQILRPLPPWQSIGISATLLDSARLGLFFLSVLLIIWKRKFSVWIYFTLLFWLVYALFLPGVNGVWRFRSIAEPAISIVIALGMYVIFCAGKDKDLKILRRNSS